MGGPSSGGRYQRGSRNVAGVVKHVENRGHSVEYRGAHALLGAHNTPSIGAGVKGIWTIDHREGRFEGTWHLWPVMAEWRAAEDDRTEADSEAADGEATNECCVCYDRAIDTCVRPCGHVALCSLCAARLRPRRCPLCRAAIESTEMCRPRAPRSAAGEGRRQR